MKCNILRVLMLVCWVVMVLPVALVIHPLIGLIVWVVGLVVILVAK
jgi:hypothetical protein